LSELESHCQKNQAGIPAGRSQTNVLNENSTPAEHSGTAFLKVLYHLVQTAKIYDDNNQLTKECLAKFKTILDELTQAEDLKIQIWRGRFHLGGEKLSYGREAVGIINEMIEYFSGRGLGGLQFFMTSRKVSPENLMRLIRLLDVSEKQEDPFNWLDQKLRGPARSWVQIYKEQEGDLKPQERAKKAYLYALASIKEVTAKSSQGMTGVRKARRLAQTIVDLVREDQSLVLGLATIKAYDDYTYAHSVNVSLLATCLGRHIGLSKVALEHLCVCGLFHDLGKVGISKKVLLKRGELNEEEWKSMRGHPLLGVRKILKLNANKEMRSKIILGPFEHHLNPDMTGYPKTHFMKKLSLLGKILRIADVYEALTANRAYRPRSFTPDEALRLMWSEVGKNFDPVLLKSFITMMGIYPVGSIVELNDGRTALVKDYPDQSPKDRPMVQILNDDGEGGLTPGETVSLSTRIMKDRSPRLEIVSSLRPSQLGVQVANFFLAEQ
jgi:HD-GYP domain-containing protein (c-di-GMP phosphodiesterase class II)